MAKKQVSNVTANGPTTQLATPGSDSNIYVFGTLGGASVTFEALWTDMVTGAKNYYDLKDSNGSIYTVTAKDGPIPLYLVLGTGLRAQVTGATGATDFSWGVR